MYSKNILVKAYAEAENNWRNVKEETLFDVLKRKTLKQLIKIAAYLNGVSKEDYVSFALIGKAYSKEDWS